MDNGPRHNTPGSSAEWILPSSDRELSKVDAGVVFPRHSTAKLFPFSMMDYTVFISFFGSKDSPFFQTAKAIAAILRASVIVASSGFIPRSIKPA